MPVMQFLGPYLAPLRRPAAALGIAAVLTCLGGYARADEKPVAAAKRVSAGPPIALIDLKYIFDHHAAFQRAKAEMDIELKLAEAMAVLRKASIEKLTKDRQKHQHGSPAYRDLDQLLDQETAALAIQVELWRKQFVRQEAELYHQTYGRIQSLVDAYVEEQGISVVLRFDRGEVEDASDIKEVAVLLSRPIVAYHKPADITDEILRRLEKSAVPEVVRQPKKSAKSN